MARRRLAHGWGCWFRWEWILGAGSWQFGTGGSFILIRYDTMVRYDDMIQRTFTNSSWARHGVFRSTHLANSVPKETRNVFLKDA